MSMAGDWVLLVALPIHVYDLTGSTLATGGVVAASVIARLLIGPFAGVYVDRWDRRRTMLFGDLALAAVVAPLALVTSEGRVWIVYGVAFCSAAIVQFVDPAESALVPRLVPPELLASANGLNALNNNLARLIGPAIGGFAAAMGIKVVVGLDVGSFLVAAALLAGVAGTHRPERTEEHHVLTELVDGLRLVRHTYVVAVLIGLVFATSIGEGVLGTLFAPFVLDEVGGGARDLGWMMTAQAIGGITGALLAGGIVNRHAPWVVVGTSMTLFGVIDLAIFTYPRWFTGVLPVLVLFVLVGIPGGVGFAALFTILQVSVADEYRGRVFAVVGVLSAAGALVGAVDRRLAGGALRRAQPADRAGRRVRRRRPVRGGVATPPGDPRPAPVRPRRGARPMPWPP